ncbi:hypothetical protein CDEST_06674 [Colletotrichum destructivum]|uniref:Uncharacterized protein n=1 Tax=Colletotrichum destructivum TaxID=34406 RepID=A0AAX4IF08_9PEZI|nr:hypothetical protein CDEST_06674 [Colletotrichum destructivum]
MKQSFTGIRATPEPTDVHHQTTTSNQIRHDAHITHHPHQIPDIRAERNGKEESLRETLAAHLHQRPNISYHTKLDPAAHHNHPSFPPSSPARPASSTKAGTWHDSPPVQGHAHASSSSPTYLILPGQDKALSLSHPHTHSLALVFSPYLTYLLVWLRSQTSPPKSTCTPLLPFRTPPAQIGQPEQKEQKGKGQLEKQRGKKKKARPPPESLARLGPYRCAFPLSHPPDSFIHAKNGLPATLTA